MTDPTLALFLLFLFGIVFRVLIVVYVVHSLYKRVVKVRRAKKMDTEDIDLYWPEKKKRVKNEPTHGAGLLTTLRIRLFRIWVHRP